MKRTILYFDGCLPVYATDEQEAELDRIYADAPYLRPPRVRLSNPYEDPEEAEDEEAYPD